LRAWRLFEKVEGNRATAGTDHSQPAPPRQHGDTCGERRVHSYAIQDERGPDTAGDLADMVRGVRATRDDVIGAVLPREL
jgi:hypothetical protein